VVAGRERDLRALFSSNDRGLTADEAFTNRQEQWDLFAAALTEHLRRVADGAVDVDDLEAPRDNALVFYGVGGIGKTTLSRKLEAALTRGGHRPAQWGEPSWPGGRILPVRIDLARSAGAGFERIMLTIRLALTEVGRPLPAFDIALRRYWERHHPGEPLEDYLRRSGLASRFGQALPGQLQSAFADVAQLLLLPGTVGSVVGQVTGALVGALRERRQTVRALADCARLADLLEAEPDVESLSYYAHLLAWELARLPEEKSVTPVVLLDTFEDVGGRNRDLERLLQRVVWLMPNCFFVITGRGRLRWADAALVGELDWTGPASWPGLAADVTPPARSSATGRGRQILIGDLAAEDCEDYLVRRLEREGQPLIGQDIREVISSRSHGLPLFLDLSVMRFLEIRRSGRTPQPADFAHDFAALITRTLSDLTPDERHVARSASLLDAFDVTLATRAAGLTREAPAMRLIERPLVREDPFGLWPYHLHSLIRSAIRGADDTTEDRWSPGDWRAAAERALVTLGEQWRASPAADRRLLVGCLRQGLALARDFHLDLDWLGEAAWSYVSDSVWEPLAPPDRDHQADTLVLGTAADALVELLSALARRQHEHRERTADRLTAVVDSGLLPADVQEMAVYYLAKADRDLGRSEASRRGMQQVADGGGRRADAARRGLAHLARLAGDFPTAAAAAETLGWAGRQRRVEGDVWWPQGNMARAAAAYAAARDEAEHHGVAGERATCQAQLAFTLAFSDPELSDDELDLAQRLLSGLDLRATTFTTRIAALVRDAGANDVDNRARLLRTEIDIAGLTATQAPTLELAVSFHHAVLDDDHQAVDASITRLRDLTRGGDYAYYVDIAAYMGGRSPTAPSPARWLNGPETTRERWRALVRARRNRGQR
jgi:hypothetical protein